MQNVQRWSENVMKHNDFDGRMLIELDDASSKKIMENGETETESCRMVELTDKQNAEDKQLDGLTEHGQQPEGRELAADDRWLERLSITMNEISAQADGWMAAWAAMPMKSL